MDSTLESVAFARLQTERKEEKIKALIFLIEEREKTERSIQKLLETCNDIEETIAIVSDSKFSVDPDAIKNLPYSNSKDRIAYQYGWWAYAQNRGVNQ